MLGKCVHVSPADMEECHPTIRFAYILGVIEFSLLAQSDRYVDVVSMLEVFR